MVSCPHCHASTLQRTKRTLGERLLRRAAAYQCPRCGRRRTVRLVKHCWRCGTDLDRRKRQTALDYLAIALVLWPYSCRRCAVRRYRWGKKSG